MFECRYINTFHTLIRWTLVGTFWNPWILLKRLIQKRHRKNIGDSCQWGVSVYQSGKIWRTDFWSIPKGFLAHPPFFLQRNTWKSMVGRCEISQSGARVLILLREFWLLVLGPQMVMVQFFLRQSYKVVWTTLDVGRFLSKEWGIWLGYGPSQDQWPPGLLHF